MGRALLVVIALSVPSSALAQFASDLDRRDALSYYQQGRELMSAEQFEKAVEAFQLSIEKDALLTPSHYGLGEAYMALKRYASAIQAFTRCRDTHLALHGMAERGRVDLERQREDEIRELRELIRVLRGMPNTNLRVVRVETRIQELNRRRTSNPGGFQAPPELLLALGSAYFRNGQLTEAEQEWKAAADANSQLGEAHNNLAAFYAMTGRKELAEDAVRHAERARFRVNPQLKEDIRQME
jgi:tetratricopeptide (TPR) repeat protein